MFPIRPCPSRPNLGEAAHQLSAAQIAPVDCASCHDPPVSIAVLEPGPGWAGVDLLTSNRTDRDQTLQIRLGLPRISRCARSAGAAVPRQLGSVDPRKSHAALVSTADRIAIDGHRSQAKKRDAYRQCRASCYRDRAIAVITAPAKTTMNRTI